LSLPNKGIVIGQFDKDDVEALGLVKMDILGLRTHSAIEDALDHIEAREGIRPDIEALPLDDEPSTNCCAPRTPSGSSSLRAPDSGTCSAACSRPNFEDIIANISLFRPGPVQADMITPYIMRRHGLQEVSYPHPASSRSSAAPSAW
jgi:error-prone DNA polymerase